MTDIKRETKQFAKSFSCQQKSTKISNETVEKNIFSEYQTVKLKKTWRDRMTKGREGIIVEAPTPGSEDVMVEFPSINQWDLIPKSMLKLSEPKFEKK